MSLDVLWAGWRMPYIRKAGKEGAPRGCLFCAMAKMRPGKRALLLVKTPRVLAMLNRYPYSVGHVMVAPRRHVPSFSGLTEEEAVEVTEWLGRMELAIGRVYRPHGFNVGLNLGRVAGAGVLGHLHWHVVPRWSGDTNFMPAVAGAKVIPEPLDRTYERLSNELASGRARSDSARGTRSRRGTRRHR